MNHFKIDRDAILKNHSIEDVIGKFITLKKKGKHYEACCPFHEEKSPSFKVTPDMGLFKCFGCGESGNAIDFIMKLKNLPFKEACDMIEHQPQQPEQPKRKRKQQQDLTPKQLPQIIRHIKHGIPSAVFPWHNKEGKIFAYTCRFDLPDGKEVLPYTYKLNGWQWAAPESPRPLYNLHLILSNPQAKIILCEGEKTANAVQYHYSPDQVVVTTWLGGCNAITQTDLQPLYNRSVFLWPDNDVQGLSAMLHIMHLLDGKTNISGLITLNYNLPKGWDAADTEWTRSQLTDYIRGNRGKLPQPDKDGLYRLNQVGTNELFEFGLKDNRWQQPKRTEALAEAKQEDRTPIESIPIDNEQQIIEAVRIFIEENYNIYRNAITHKLENNGVEMVDESFNSLFLKCRYAYNSKKITREIVDTFLNSDFIQTVNPIRQFIDKHRHIQTTGNIDRLIESIETDTPDAAIYVRKWLIQLMAALDYKPFRSVLTLVGGQNTGKSEWFRRLLPPDLKRYYGESKLDRGKDDELLMCENWIILDDEMGGKSKKDEKLFKDLTSKQEFSLRAAYQRSNRKYRRLAVLCGTSNDMQLISDPTGNTRILPVNVISMNHDLYNSIDKIALLMEVVRCYEAGDKWELTRDELKRLEEASDEFRPIAFERELICKFFAQGSTPMTSTDIKIKIETETSQKILNMKMFGTMLTKLFGKSKLMRVNGKPERVYMVDPVLSVTSQEPENQDLPF